MKRYEGKSTPVFTHREPPEAGKEAGTEPGEHGSGAARPSGSACAAGGQGATGPPVTAEDFCVFLFLVFSVCSFGSRGREARGGAQEIRERPCRDGGTKRSGTTGLTLVFCFAEGVFFGLRPLAAH